MTGAAFRVERGTAASRVFSAVALALVALLASLPLWADSGVTRLAGEMAYYLALAQLWNLLAGYAGLVSVGQQAYVGLGGYALFVLCGSLGVPPLLAIPLAGAVAAALSLPIALIVFRLRGAQFAVGTWVVAEVCQLIIAQVPSLGSGSGQSLTASVVRAIAASRPARETIFYECSLAAGLAVLALVYALLRSRLGLALTAIRDSEPASRSVGVDTFRTKLLTYVIVAFCTGAVGGLIFLQKLRISPESGFSLQDWTVVAIFMVVIGGIGTIEGPILGLIIYFALRQLLADYGSWYLIIMGCVAVFFMLYARDGIWGWIAARFHLQLFPVRRHLSRTVRRRE
ncbi:MAG: branched-chain amino acid ABC transporter permease [Stellaceae bacterium]